MYKLLIKINPDVYLFYYSKLLILYSIVLQPFDVNLVKIKPKISLQFKV